MGLFLSSCSLVSSEPVLKSDKSYSFKIKNSKWSQVKDKKVDYLFKHQDGGIVYSKSYCDYFKGNVKKISDSFIKKINHSEIREQNNQDLKGHPARFTALSSNMDGKEVFIYHQAIKTGSCYYDITGIGHNSTFKESFQDLIQRLDL